MMHFIANDVATLGSAAQPLAPVGVKRTLGDAFARPAADSASKRQARDGGFGVPVQPRALSESDIGRYMESFFESSEAQLPLCGDGDGDGGLADNGYGAASDHMAVEELSPLSLSSHSAGCSSPESVSSAPASPHVSGQHTGPLSAFERKQRQQEQVQAELARLQREAEERDKARKAQEAAAAASVVEQNQLLLKAARAGKLKRVRACLARGADVNYEAQSCSVLHYAAFYNHKHIVRSLVESGADVNRRNLSGVTPLHWALEKGELDLMRLLVERGADVNIGDKDALSVLHKAVTSKQYEALEYLLALDPSVRLNVNAAASEANQCLTPLHIAATMGELRAVRMLLAAGADVAAVTTRGATALHKAAVRGHTEVVRELVAVGGAAVDGQDEVGRTPLHWAVFYHRVGAVRELRRLGADPHKHDRFGSSAFALAARKNFGDVTVALADGA